MTKISIGTNCQQFWQMIAFISKCCDYYLFYQGRYFMYKSNTVWQNLVMHVSPQSKNKKRQFFKRTEYSFFTLEYLTKVVCSEGRFSSFWNLEFQQFLLVKRKQIRQKALKNYNIIAEIFPLDKNFINVSI